MSGWFQNLFQFLLNIFTLKFFSHTHILMTSLNSQEKNRNKFSKFLQVLKATIRKQSLKERTRL